MLQMLTSKDSNFIGFTFKKSDLVMPIENSGILLFYVLSIWVLSPANVFRFGVDYNSYALGFARFDLYFSLQNYWYRRYSSFAPR